MEICRHCGEPNNYKHTCPDVTITGDEQVVHIINGGTPYPHNMAREQWRHELAARAMGAIFSNTEIYDGSDHNVDYAELAYGIADAMLKEGDKNE